MTAIAYPSSLPGPSAAPFEPTERRALSSLPGPRRTRPAQLDRGATQSVDFIFTHDERSEFTAWVDDTLVGAGAWFASSWPQPQGGVGVRRFVGEPTDPIYYPGIGWHVSAICEVRGRGELPQAPPIPSGYAGTSTRSAADASGGVSLTPVARTMVGDGLVFAVLTQNGAVVTMPEEFTLVGTRQDSSGGLRLHVYSAPAADAGSVLYSVSFGPSIATLTTWRTVDDPAFPALVGAWVGGLDAGTGSGVSPREISRGFTGPKLALAYLYIESNYAPPVGAEIGDPAPGYEVTVREEMTYDNVGTPFYVQFLLAYKEFEGDYENASSFPDGSGEYGGGGQGAVAVLLAYAV